MVNVLVLCTGNSCRSVLGEALFNKLGEGRVKAFSAGSKPLGRINQKALATLRRHGLTDEGYQSQSWSEYEDKGIDIAITVCDNAANEECPVFLNAIVRGHWGLSDPGHLEGTVEEIEAAFDVTYNALVRRIKAFLALPFEEMESGELSKTLNEIGNIDG